METEPKSLAATRWIAEVALAFNLSPTEVLEADPVLLREMVSVRNEQVEEQNAAAREAEMKSRLKKKMRHAS